MQHINFPHALRRLTLSAILGIFVAGVCGECANATSVFSLVLFFSHVHEEEVVNVVVRVNSLLIEAPFLEYLVSVSRTVHLHLRHLSHELVLVAQRRLVADHAWLGHAVVV